MKLLPFIILAACLLVSAVSQSQESRITLHLENTPISKVLGAVEAQTTYRFVYANNFFPADRNITLHCTDTLLNDALDFILKNTGFTFRITDDLVILTSLIPARIVTGKVTSLSGEPIAGVTISDSDGKTLTATNVDGIFSAEVQNGQQLVLSSVGYLSEKIILNGGNTIDVQMKEAVQDLAEVVMVGFGQRMKQDITGAMSLVTPKQVEMSQALTPELGMQGQMAGVSVVTGGSNPTARHKVRIRGVGTFSGNGAADPLYIIDGIPLVEGGAGATVDKTNDPTRRGPINLYTMINPNDIESIVVLKDAAAAIYGVRAANGVVLITTRSGKKGPVRVDLNAVYGIQKVTKTYDLLNTQQYVEFYTDAYNANPDVLNNIPVPIGEATQFGLLWDPANAQYFGNDPTYDWQNAIIHAGSRVQNYNVRASGESENINYSFSVGYSGNEGPFAGYMTDRYSLGANIVARVGKYIELGMNVRGVQQHTNNTPGDAAGISMDVWRAPPWQKITDPQGPNGFAPLWKLNAPITPATFDKTSIYGQQYAGYRNVFGLLSTSENLVQNQTGLGTAFIQVSPIQGLKLKGTISGQQTSISSRTWQGFDRWWFLENPFNPYTNVVNPVEGTKPGLSAIANSATISLIRSFNFDYQKEFNGHHINITFDASQQNYRWTGDGAGRAVTSGNQQQRYFSVTGNENGFYELRANYALIGYMARISYNNNSRYYADVIVRRDGSSRFAPGKQWGTFPSALLAWRISKETFMKNIPVINDFKIRAGYGILGNEQTTGGWSYLAISGVVRPSYNLGTPQVVNPGISFSSFPNRDLTWERLRTGNIGFDALFFNSHLSITADYYHKVTKGIIQSVELSPSSGITTNADINIAEVLNSGIEFQVAYNKVIGKVGLNFTGNFTTVHNKVLKLANHTALRNAGLEEGMPIGFLYGYKARGIFQSEKEIEEWKLVNRDIISTEQKPGDIYFDDLYGNAGSGTTERNNIRDSVINENDRTYLGKTIAGHYYGFTASAVYKSFDFSIFFQGVGDVQKYNDARALGESMDDYGRSQFTSVLNAWTEQNKSTAMPRAVYDDPNGNNRISDRFVEDAGYIRLQNIQAGYTLPKKLTSKTDVIQNLRFFISAINLLTITKYTGLDPEDDNFPATKQFLVGVKATFN